MVFKDLLKKVFIIIVIAFFISCDDGSNNQGTQPGINASLISGTWSLKEIQIQQMMKKKNQKD